MPVLPGVNGWRSAAGAFSYDEPAAVLT
jgi:hypothetical protein